MTVKEVVPFFAVENIQASLDFYVNGLGFKVEKSWEPEGEVRWCHLQLDDAGIMLQQHLPNQIQDPKGTGVSVYFMCEDAIALYREIQAKGLDPQEPFVSNTMWVTSIKDPDGYDLHFESFTEVAEDTKLSEYENNN